MFTHRIFTLTFFIVLLALLTSGPAIAQVRTVRVSPDPSATPDPLVSGQNLLDALAAVPATPERWLLDIEPGVYDLDGRTLTLRNRIDLEGSGRGLTVIRSTGTTVIDCPAGVTAELRELTIAGVNSGLTNASDGLRVTRVDIGLVLWRRRYRAESFSAVGIATFGEIVIETSKVEGWSYSIEGFDPPYLGSREPASRDGLRE